MPIAATTFGLLGVAFLLARGGRVSALFIAAAVAAALALIGAVLGVRALLILVVFSGVAYPFIRYPQLHPYATFDRMMLPAFFGMLLLHPTAQMVRARASRVLVSSTVWLVLAFGFRALAAGPHHTSAIVTWLDAIVIPAVIFLAAERFLASEKGLSSLADALTVAGVALALVGIGERVLGFDLASRTGGTPRFDQNIGVVRISGPFAVPEVYGLVLVVCLAGTLYRAQTRRRGASWAVGLGAVCLELVALESTYFRAVWFAGLAVAVAAFGFRPRRFGRLLVVLAVVGGILFLASSQLQQDQTIQARLNNTQNIDARLATYRQALTIARMDPVFGVGVNRYTDVAETLPRASVAGVGSVPYPHNSYLGLLAEQGLVGLLPLLAVSLAAWGVFRRLKTLARTREDVLLAAMLGGIGIAYLAMSLSLTMLPYGPSNGILAVVLGAAAGRLNALESESVLDTAPELRGGEARRAIA